MLMWCVGENVLKNMLFVNISSYWWTTFNYFKALNKIQNSNKYMVSIFNANIIFKLSLRLQKYMDSEKIDNNRVEEFNVLLHNYPKQYVF
jgi:hypothetical protein